MRQHLIIDADDTLWENNIYFERAFDDFVEFLAHSTMTAAEVRTVLDEIELVNSKVHGYGSANFGRNLQQCYRRLCEREIRGEDLDRAMLFAERIASQPLQLIDGVAARLTAFSKGDADYQWMTLDSARAQNRNRSP